MLLAQMDLAIDLVQSMDLAHPALPFICSRIAHIKATN